MDSKIKALACVLAWSGVAQADWMFLPVQGAVGTLAHLETGWVLNVNAEEDHWKKGFTNLTVTGVATAPAAPCLLPLGDTMPSGLSIVAIADRNGYGASVFELVCASLTAVTLPNTLRSIGSYSFCMCTSLEGTLVIPEGVTNIGDNAFANCSGLTALVLPEGLARIGVNAFGKCAGLTGPLVIPGSVTRVEEAAFGNCINLTELTVSFGVTALGDSAFANCVSLTNRVVLPEGLTEIGYGAFSDCSGLSHVVIPEGVISLGPGVFAGCDNLIEVVYTGGPPQQAADDIYAATSYLWPGPTKYYYAPVTSYVHAAWVSAWAPVLGSGSFEADDASWRGRPIKVFGQASGPADTWRYSVSGRITHNRYLWTLEVEAVDASGTNLAVTGCLQSPDYTCPAPLPLGDPIEGGYQIVAIKDRTSADNYLGNGAIALTLPTALKHIGDHAFSHMNSLLGNLVIPSGVTNIGYGAFASNQRMTGEIAIPDGMVRIADYAFCNCGGFKRLRVGRGVQFIENAFASHSFNVIMFEGEPPGFVGYDFNSVYANPTLYIFPNYTNDWQAVLASGSFETDDAIWKGRPVRVLNADGTLGVPARIMAFVVEPAVQGSDATVQFSWESAVGACSGYIVYGCENLGNAKWLPLPVDACGTTPSFGRDSTVESIPAAGNRFFRIQALP